MQRLFSIYDADLMALALVIGGEGSGLGNCLAVITLCDTCRVKLITKRRRSRLVLALRFCASACRGYTAAGG